MTLAQLLELFAREQDLGEWRPDDDGRFTVTFDAALDVQFEAVDRSRFVIRSVLTRVPGDPQAANDLFNRLLRFNLAQWHQQAESIAIDQERQEIFIYRMENAEELDYAGFSAQVEEFVNRVELWQAQIRQPVPPSSPFSMVFP